MNITRRILTAAAVAGVAAAAVGCTDTQAAPTSQETTPQEPTQQPAADDEPDDLHTDEDEPCMVAMEESPLSRGEYLEQCLDTTVVEVGETFDYGDWTVTVHSVEPGVPSVNNTDYEETVQSEHGHMVVVNVTVTNAGMEPLVWWEDVRLLDEKGRQFSESDDAMSIGLGYEQQPEEASDGKLVFDVPTSVETFDGLWLEDTVSTYETVFVDFAE